MRRTLAFIVVVGLSVGIADADDPTLPPEKDARLAKVADAKPTRIGILTYYPNQGGGYTFLEGREIAFCALPYYPTTSKAQQHVFNGMLKPPVYYTIGTAQVPTGCQILYRSATRTTWSGRVIPIALWTRDSFDGTFHLSILSEDYETRLKLKSIVPVLEHAGHAP
jgi:hypothetical protein